MMLKDNPAWPKFVERLTEAIKDLSLLYAGTDDDSAHVSLQTFIGNILPELTEAVGASTAVKLLEAFASAVMGEKHKMESGGASRA